MFISTPLLFVHRRHTSTAHHWHIAASNGSTTKGILIYQRHRHAGHAMSFPALLACPRGPAFTRAQRRAARIEYYISLLVFGLAATACVSRSAQLTAAAMIVQLHNKSN